jgi:hypothetical protein
VRAHRRAARSLSTITFSAGRRAQAANSPSSAIVTASHSRPRSDKNVQNTFSSRA